VIAAGLAGAAVAVRRARTPGSASSSADRWLAVTVNCEPEDLRADKLPSHSRSTANASMFKQKSDGCVKVQLKPEL